MAQADIFAQGAGPGFAALVRKRLGAAEWFAVPDVAGAFNVSATSVHQWIEEGRLVAADINAGRVSGKGSPMRPYWRVTRASAEALADRIERGY
ncbi:MAG: hypothetical protein FWH21_00205 [Kiritimatiellaeota bacterium]|nr:hypothetical protein [Kiritimatiellota bacterium]